jgi:hypothetical protein
MVSITNESIDILNKKENNNDILNYIHKPGLI